MDRREKIIAGYIAAYNSFDIEKMLADMDAEIVFKNISDGVTDMHLTGIAEFKEQALRATQYFSSRHQSITSLTHTGNGTEVVIDYHAILAIDLPNGLKKGDALDLKGRSVFKFTGDKITTLTDIS